MSTPTSYFDTSERSKVGSWLIFREGFSRLYLNLVLYLALGTSLIGTLAEPVFNCMAVHVLNALKSRARADIVNGLDFNPATYFINDVIQPATISSAISVSLGLLALAAGITGIASVKYWASAAIVHCIVIIAIRFHRQSCGPASMGIRTPLPSITATGTTMFCGMDLSLRYFSHG
jgi:hypothetical protein